MLGFQLTQLTMRNLRLKSCGCLVTQSSKINYKQLGFHELRDLLGRMLLLNMLNYTNLFCSRLSYRSINGIELCGAFSQENNFALLVPFPGGSERFRD